MSRTVDKAGRQALSVDDGIKLKRDGIRQLWKDHVNPGMVQLLSSLDFDRNFIRAEGTRLQDDDGNEYLDFLGGYGALNFGHNHPYIIESLRKVFSLPNMVQASISSLAGVLAHNIARLAPGDLEMVSFSNSGAESVEAALKMARIATGRSGFVTCEKAYHGKTMGALSVTDNKKYSEPFRPLIDGVAVVPFGEVDPLEKALREKPAAFIVEPIQGEGGIRIPPPGYLKKANELCKKAGTLLILDEVQTGFGRTGTVFACQAEDMVPDIMTLAKSLGGGLMPIGAVVTTSRIWDAAYGGINKCLLHSNTFGGNTWAMAAGIASLELLEKENLAGRAAVMGDRLMEGLRELKEKHPLIKDVRGRGLMTGVEFTSGPLLGGLSKEYLASLVSGELLYKHRILTAYTMNDPNVLRLEPPLIVTEDEIARMVSALDEVLTRGKSFVGLGLSAGGRMLKR
ncbi:MAG: aspartate aminotransferase family protein [Chloroflexi bacterium]|nr:aspartate aminotransferase family protein [Chloroflexota bacterium]